MFLPEQRLTLDECVEGYTINAARAGWREATTGSLAPGKWADFVVLGRNPLENIRHTNTIRMVMKNGELYEGDSLRMVWPEPRPLPTPYWEQFGPKPAPAPAPVPR